MKTKLNERKKEVKDYFERNVWDSLSSMHKSSAWTFIFMRKQKAVVEALKPKKIDKILEVGAGTGLAAIFLARYCKFVVATDVSRSMLKKARLHSKSLGLSNRMSFVVCDAFSLPFKNSCFTSGVCVGLLHHIFPFELGLMEILRTTNKFVCLEPNHMNPLRRLERNSKEYIQAHETDFIFRDLKKTFSFCNAKKIKMKYIIFMPPMLRNGSLLKLMNKLSLIIEKFPILKYLAGNLVVYCEK